MAIFLLCAQKDGRTTFAAGVHRNPNRLEWGAAAHIARQNLSRGNDLLQDALTTCSCQLATNSEWQFHLHLNCFLVFQRVTSWAARSYELRVQLASKHVSLGRDASSVCPVWVWPLRHYQKYKPSNASELPACLPARVPAPPTRPAPA